MIFTGYCVYVIDIDAARIKTAISWIKYIVHVIGKIAVNILNVQQKVFDLKLSIENEK